VKSIRTLGIAVVMALALTAFAGAGTASASEFRSPGAGAGLTTWDGSRTGANHTVSVGNGEKISCSNVSFSGNMLGETFPQITVTPELSGCIWKGAGVSWAMHGCKYRFDAGVGYASQPMSGTLDIVECETPMSVELSGCKVSIGNQNGIGTVEYVNGLVEGHKVVYAKAKLGGLTYTRTGCTGSGTFGSGEYNGEWIVKGTRNGSPVAVEVEPGGPSRFAGEEAPLTITGSSAKDAGFLIFPGLSSLRCTEHTLSAASAVAAPESITVTPVYKGCVFLGQPEGTGGKTQQSMGGCSYVLHASGGFDIVGATCASNPITISALGCIVTVGPQSHGSNLLTYTNGGSTKGRSVTSGGEMPFIEYSKSATCPGGGKKGATDGIYKSVDRFTATNSGGLQQGFWVE
jgi:hypothetical protein